MPRVRRPLLYAVALALSGLVALSSLALAAPLLVLSPSSDFRYLLWSVAAALLAAALSIEAKANGETAS